MRRHISHPTDVRLKNQKLGPGEAGQRVEQCLLQSSNGFGRKLRINQPLQRIRKTNKRQALRRRDRFPELSPQTSQSHWPPSQLQVHRSEKSPDLQPEHGSEASTSSMI
jgi:hypothetical protein